jgi:hypothetical protein
MISALLLIMSEQLLHLQDFQSPQRGIVEYKQMIVLFVDGWNLSALLRSALNEHKRQCRQQHQHQRQWWVGYQYVDMVLSVIDKTQITESNFM